MQIVTDNMDFSCAIKALKLGRKISRVDSDYYYEIHYEDSTANKVRKYSCDDNSLITDFITICSDDVLANDWCVVI